MKAVGYYAAGPIDRHDALVDLTLPDPVLRPHDLLVRVHAVSVNPVDTKVRAKAEPTEGEARVLGFDASGIVEAVGSEVSLFKPGEPVFYAGDINRAGTDAELHAVYERLVGRKPQSIGWAESAALPLTTITAWEALFDRLDVRRPVPGAHAILIVGGGGVGSIAVQLAKARTSMTVIATGALPDDEGRMRALGADYVIDYRQPLSEGVAQLRIDAPGFVFSTTHTDAHLAEIVSLIAPQGRIALIDDPTALDIVGLKSKMLSVHWEYMFGRAIYGSPDMAQQHRLLNEVSQLIDQGWIKTTMSERLSPICADTVRQVHKRIEAGGVRGKIVIEGWG